MGAHPTAADGGKSWGALEAVDVDQPHGNDFIYSQNIAKGVRLRMSHQHSAFADVTVGGVHKPGGSSIVGMEITTDCTGGVTLAGLDGTYRGHGLVWTISDISNYGAVYCSTSTADATESDWTVMRMHPDIQWGGGDVTWAGQHQFNALVCFSGVDISGSLDCSCNVNITGTLDITGDVGITGDFSVEGTVDFGDAVAIVGDLSIDGALICSSVVDIGGLVGTCTTLSGGAVEMSSSATYRVSSCGFVSARATATGAVNLVLKIGAADPPTITYQQRLTTDAITQSAEVGALLPKDWYFDVTDTTGKIQEIKWTPLGAGVCASQ